jgi:hypothetical protein
MRGTFLKLKSVGFLGKPYRGFLLLQYCYDTMIGGEIPDILKDLTACMFRQKVMKVDEKWM